jgi:ATP-dependent Clp protease ATP-binding subunit ClpA
MTGKDPIILNMTEYIHSSSVNQIIGSNMGYVGSDSNIEPPFDCLESNPLSKI